MYSPRPAVWPGVTPIGGGSRSFDAPGIRQGLYQGPQAVQAPGGFGDVNILNDWQMIREDAYSRSVVDAVDQMFQFLIQEEAYRPKEQANGGMAAPAALRMPLNWNMARHRKKDRGLGDKYLGGEHITIADRVVAHDAVGAEAGTMSDSAPYGDACQYTVTVGYDDKRHLTSIDLVLEGI